ncbi:TIGR03016 family PEP-CTERM system-associated outer membrane protein [Salinisphaera sp. T31B1]|uniref:TIGR03016 family PEP-CTERM system-associated outer membrane protein n=1 Tax=Salinisphaera sp. T31B1 TaxID=727963 RepID=UPI00333E3A0F
MRNLQRRRLIRPSRWLATAGPVIVLAMPMAAWSQDDGGVGSAAGGASAESASPGSMSTGTGSATASGDSEDEASGLASAIRDSLAGMSGLSFQPGFGQGCATSDLSYNAFGGGSIATPLRYAPSPVGSRGRYVQASVAASETYTDNLNRDPGDRAMSDFVTSVAPRIDACSSTGRVRGELSYQLQGLVYANNSRYNDVYNDISGKTTLSLIENRVYLDADTRYGQTVVDPGFGYAQSNSLSPNRNKTSAWVSNISPYVNQSLGPVGQALLRYRYGRSVYGDADVPESTVNAVYLNVVSPDTAEPLSWRGNVVTQRVERTGGNQARFFRDNQLDGGDTFTSDGSDPSRTTYFDRASLELGYQVTQSIRLLGEGGVENDYSNPDGSIDRYSEPFWNAGIRWTSARNSLEARYGHRFYGSTYSLSARRTGRVMDARIEYREEPTTQGLNTLNGAGAIGGGGGLGGFNGAGGPTTSLFDRGVFVQKSWSAAVDFNSALTTTTITGFRQKREYQQVDDDNETYQGVDIRTRYDFTPRMALTPQASWQTRDGNGDFRGYDSYDAGVALERALSRSSQAAIGYAHSWRDGTSEYHENRIAIQFQKSF